ncbi:MAG: hemolysin family protein [Bacteroidota bacterium]|nr:hemolysin family protein [Bacteroidota bacterium]
MEVIILLLLILLNGVFSMSEIALISSKKNRLENEAKKGNVGAKTALELIKSPNRFLSTVQIGITVIGIFTGIYSGETMVLDVQYFLERFDFFVPYSKSLALVIVLIIITFWTLVLGELVPKRLGLTYPETIAKNVALPMKYISIVVAPFVAALTFATEFLLKIMGIKPNADGKVTEEEIKAIIKEGTEGGEVQEIEQDIVERVFHIGDRKINSLMTHRKSIAFLSLSDTIEQIKEKIQKEIHSIYPVCKDNNIDEVVGIVFLKDLFINFDKKQDFNLSSVLHEPNYFIEHTSAYSALETFKKSKIHYALVTDEYGITQGIITLNDILEALVGDASDFYQDEFQLTRRDDGTWLVDGHYSLHDFLTHFELDELTNNYDVTTVSGLIITELGYIPKQGEKLNWQHFCFEIIDMDGVKIDKILVTTNPVSS